MAERVYEGHYQGKGRKFALVVSRFNEFVTHSLLEGAVDCLLRHGVTRDQLTVVRVPGSFEIPVAVARLARSKQYDGIVALGAVIRGNTPHFDYVASEVAKGCAQVSLETEVPVGFGVLTCDNLEQALERAGTKAGNKGADAAMSVLEMTDLFRQLEAPPPKK